MKAKNVETAVQDIRSLRIPGLEEVSEPYRLGRQKLAELFERLRVVESRLEEIRLEVEDSGAPSQDELTARAHRLLAEGGLVVAGGRTAMHDEQIRLSDERRVLIEAIGLARREVDRLTGEASETVCNQVRDYWNAVNRKFLLALIDLGAAHEERVALRDALEARGVSAWATHLPVVLNLGLGQPRDSSSRWQQVLEDARHDRLIEESDIPTRWLESWRR